MGIAYINSVATVTLRPRQQRTKNLSLAAMEISYGFIEGQVLFEKEETVTYEDGSTETINPPVKGAIVRAQRIAETGESKGVPIGSPYYGGTDANGYYSISVPGGTEIAEITPEDGSLPMEVEVPYKYEIKVFYCSGDDY